MFIHRFPRWLYSICLFVLLVPALSSIVSADYDTATGAKPDLQSLRTQSSATCAINSFDEICADLTPNGRYAEMATLLRDEILEKFSITLDIVDLSELDNNLDQIVLGDDSYQSVKNLATACKQNTAGLGEEGYNLVSRENPNTTNGSWVILVYGDDPKGISNGLHSLIDLVDGNPPATIGDYRVRDYPDRPFRGMSHWIGPVSGSGETWVNEQKESMKVLAGTGCNTLNLGRSNFWLMEEEFDEEEIGKWLSEVAYWARYYGMEPFPELLPIVPRLSSFPDLPLLREGEFIEHEPFIITDDGNGGKYLAPAITPFNNETNNMGFETDNGGTPDRWTVTGEIDVDWIYGTEQTPTGNRYMKCISNSEESVGLSQEWPTSAFTQGSFYVLEAHIRDYDNITQANAMYIQFDLYDAEPDSHAVFFFDWIPGGPGTFTKNIYFWMPPDSENPPGPGYEGPYYDDFEAVRIKIYRNYGPHPTIRIDDLFLERRAGALRNVMYDPSKGLDFIVLGLDTTTTYTYPADFDWANPSALVEPGDNYRMPTDYLANDNKLTVIWEDATLGVDDTVLVSYTAGVPSDWHAGQQATTYCLNNPRIHDHIEEALRHLYKEYNVSVGDGKYAINPKFIDLRLDEFRGANRCGRCVAAERSNAAHFINYIKTFQELLDGIADEPGHEEAANTALLTNSNLLGPVLHGSADDYQFGWGGPWGQCSAELGDQEGLPALNNTNAKLVIGVGDADRSTHGWPQDFLATGQTNVSVVTGLSATSGTAPEEIVIKPTWYEDDCLGFATLNHGTVHEPKEFKLMDYAWKRYSMPDATMHARVNGIFIIDDVSGDIVQVGRGETLFFYPFGHTEIREDGYDDWSISAATITWGSTTIDVMDELNTGGILYTGGSTDVTLTVEAEYLGGLYPMADTVDITVDKTGGIQEQAEGAGDKPVPFGFRSVSPNPFNPSTRIQIGLSRPGPVQLVVYDVSGRRVTTLLNTATKPAGIHTVVWNGTSAKGEQVASGIYFLRLLGENQVQTKKLVLLK
jgi:hypothetical protein